MEKGSYGSYALHFESLLEACIPSLESFAPTMTKLRSGQEKWVAAAAPDDAADQSNPYMSPSQATQKQQETPQCDKTRFSTLQPSIDMTGIRNERWQ